MKIRMDFVTNSSSSSFLVGRKHNGELTAEGKEKLANLLMEFIVIGRNANPIKKDNLDDYCSDDEDREEMEKTIKDGFEVVEGVISYDESDCHLMKLVDDVLDILKSEPNFKVLPYDLDY